MPGGPRAKYRVNGTSLDAAISSALVGEDGAKSSEVSFVDIGVRLQPVRLDVPRAQSVRTGIARVFAVG